MKSVAKEYKSKQDKPFPKLMIAVDGDIVLFSSPGEGTYVHVAFKQRNMNRIGDTNAGAAFNMCMFKDYDGDVLLSNY